MSYSNIPKYLRVYKPIHRQLLRLLPRLHFCFTSGYQERYSYLTFWRETNVMQIFNFGGGKKRHQTSNPKILCPIASPHKPREKGRKLIKIGAVIATSRSQL